MTRMMKACSVFLCAMLTVVFCFACTGGIAEQAGGNLRNGPYQCTDCGETVKFTVENMD